MKKIFSLIFTALLIISILSALNIAHSPEVQGQFVVDNYTLALWHFNEGEGQVVHDESPHHNDGTLGSTLNAEDRDPSWVSGFTGSSGDYALSFDQWYDYAIVPDNPDGSLDLQLLPQFTIEFYAYSRQISRADRGNGQHWNRFLQKEFVTGDVNRAEDITGYGAEQSSYPQPTALLGFDMANYGKGLGFSCLPPPLNEWVLVTIVYKKDNYCSIYFNNVLQLQTFVENVNFTDNAAPLTIGKWIGWDYPWLDAIDGIIDEVRLSSIARITEQGQFVVDDYTLALWHLNEGEGQVVHDESVHHNDGTLGGTSNVEDVDPSWVGGFTGEPGDYALSFDDWYDYAHIPDNSDGSLDVQLLDQFTIEFWTNLRQVSRSDRGDGTHWNRFLEKGYIAYGPPDICGYGIYQCLGYNSLSAWVQDYGTENWQIGCSPAPPLSTWVLVSLVYDGNYARIYFNNVMQSEREVGWIDFTDTTAPLTLGKWPGEDWPWADSVDGIIDEVRLSSIARDRVHNIDTGVNYGTIQEAIDAPETLNSHTIHVDAGTYYGTIVVGKSVNLVGENRETTIIDGNESMTVVLAKADHVSISKFTVQNSYRHIEVTGHISLGKPAGGIALEGCIGCTVTNNKIEQCGAGVAICIGSGDNVITGNIVHGLPPPGYFAYFGITDWAGPQTPVGGNTISFNYIEGFETGILLDDTTNDEIHENRILLSGSWGIMLGGSNNRITQNVIKGSKEYGIVFSSASGNTICHNDFIDNTVQVYIDAVVPPVNVWDDGYPSGGNYWSDYAGVDWCWGENQDRNDSGDTIGDTPYVIEVDNEDRYPLMDRWSFQGDIDRNGKVNIIDVSMAARSFGAQPGEIRWDYKADVNRDGVVNILDLAKIATQFNKVRWQFE